jgi:dipeptidyl aminopeptidase/acylaminoacyl peptidase
MTTLDLADVLDDESPGAPEWTAGGDAVAATVYEDDGDALLVARLGNAAEPTVDRYRPGDGHVSGFEWRPGRAELAVTTDEGELFLLDSDGEQRLLAEATDGIWGTAWGSDGDRLAYYRGGTAVVRSFESGTERELSAPANDRFLPGDRPVAWDEDGDHLAVQFVDRETTQVGVVEAASGELSWRTDDRGATGAPAWLADGRLLVDRRRDDGTVREVVAVDTDDGAKTVLAEEVDRERGTVSLGVPELSPDGTRVALALALDGWSHVHVVDVGTGERTQLTEGSFEDEGLAGSAPQSVDDDTLVFASNRRDPGQRQLFAVDLDGTVAPVVESEGTNVHPAPSPDGEHVAYVHADRERSPEIRVAPLDVDGDAGATTGDAARITRSAVDDWPAEPIPPEHVTLESHDGTEVHAYVIDPRGHGVDADATDLPALVWVHGGPMRQMRDGWHPSRSYGLAYAAHQYFARQGYVGLLVNYRGGIGYGREFRRSLADGYGRDEMGDVVAATEHLKTRSAVDEDAVGIWGLSYGGYATLQLLGTDPGVFDVGINLAGLADLCDYEEWAEETKYPAAVSSQNVVFGGTPWDAPDAWDDASPVTHMEQYEAPLYSFHGTGDRYVNVGQQDVVVDRLLDLEAEFEAEYYPDEGHVFGRRSVWRRTLSKIEAALDEHL